MVFIELGGIYCHFLIKDLETSNSTCDHRFDISYKSGPPSPKHHKCSSCYFDEYDLQDGSIDCPHTDDPLQHCLDQ